MDELFAEVQDRLKFAQNYHNKCVVTIESITAERDRLKAEVETLRKMLAGCHETIEAQQKEIAWYVGQREDTGRLKAEVERLRAELATSERVAAAYRRQAASSIQSNWQLEFPAVSRAQCNAAVDRVLDQIRDEAIAGRPPEKQICPTCQERPISTSLGYCAWCDTTQGGGW